ncbi:MAG: hypothetical protein ABI352_09355 [Candidatus Dormibacter sp.]
MPTITAHGWVLAMVSPVPGTVAPGGRGRTVLVVGDDAELATAIRDRLDRAYVTVVEVPPGEELVAIRGCRPWPWMVVGAGEHVDPSVLAELGRSPALLIWRGSSPPGLPARAIAADRFTVVVGTVATALGAEVAGMHLAIGSGVDMPDGSHVSNACLEALVASHPRPLVAPSRLVRSAARALAAHAVPLRPRSTADGGVVLAPVDET